MRAADAIRLTEETVRQFRAQGAEEQARALEGVLSVAVTALGVQRIGLPPEYLTPAQAARALAVSPQFIKRLVASGEIESERIDGQVVLSRAALLAFTQAPRQDPTERGARTPEEDAEEARRHEFIMKGLPADQLARLEALHEQVEEGKKPSGAEQAEMTTLERTLAEAAAKRLQEWSAGPSATRR
jgi:excisionase family DNA binding protein